MEDQKALDRYLSPLDVWAMAFGCTLGWGTLVMPGTTFLPVAGPAGTLLAMLAGTLLMLVIGSNFSYLMAHSPHTGGLYTYAKEAFGRDHAFLSSWFLCMSYLTIVFLNGTALFVVIRTLLGNTLQVGPHYTVAGNEIFAGELCVSVSALAGVGILFVVAKPFLQKLHTILSVVLALGIAALAVCCMPRTLTPNVLTAFGTQGIGGGYAVFSLVILAPWAFVGFETAAFDTAHFKFPIRMSKRIMFAAIVMAGLAYSAMTLVAVAVVPDGFATWQDYIRQLDSLSGLRSVPTFHTAYTIMGAPGLAIISATALAAILTGLIGGYRATMRVLSTMAEDRILSEMFANSTVSILFVMLISIGLAFLGRNTLNWFVDLTSFGAIVGYGYTSASTYKMARIEASRPHMVAGAIGTVVSVVFVIVQLVPRVSAMETMGGEAFLLLSLWCLLGFLFYWRTVRKSTLTEFSGMSTSGVVLFALLLYSALMWIAHFIAAQESVEAVHRVLTRGGIALLTVVFVGLSVMLYVQNQVRKQHEEVEREKIRAVEGNLAKSRFLFNMSHDIRTPMNAIIGYTNLALKEPASDVLHDYLTKIDRSSHHLLALINDILEMSRIESGKVELEFAPTDLPGVFADIEELFSEQMHEKGIDFHVYATKVKNPYVWCDSKNLNRVLLNIISNAYKFTSPGGEIAVSLAETGTGEYGFSSYEIRVRDNGIGMSKAFVERMFTAFERERTSTASGVEGTGLGLAITKSIVDLMDGTIEVLTSPGSGTEMIVRLRLDLVDEAEAKAQQALKESASVPQQFDFSGVRVLLVEDNEINMEIARLILEEEGFEVDEAENGKIAVEKIEAAEARHYSLVLMDIQMPVMDGYEATRAIRALPDANKAATPVVAMTANAFKEDEEASAMAGMQAHIAKPIDTQSMLSTIDRVLAAYREGGDKDRA